MVTLVDLDLCHNQLSGQIPSGILSASKNSRLSNSSLQSLNLSKLTYFADVYMIDYRYYMVVIDGLDILIYNLHVCVCYVFIRFNCAIRIQ